MPGWSKDGGASVGLKASEFKDRALCENQSLHKQSNFRLLVVRLGAMGDILHALPAITALRKAHPEWTIDWVVDPRWQALLTAGGSNLRTTGAVRGPEKPVVDVLHLAPAKQWGRRPFSLETLREIRNLRCALRARSYDVVLDVQGAIRSAVIARFAGSPRVIGESFPREHAARWLFTQRVETQGAHVIEQDVELASAVAGDTLTPKKPLLPVDPECESWCDQVLSATAAPAVLMNPGAGWGAKRWPPERYAAVARGLIDRGFNVLINTGPGEGPLAQVIVSATRGEARQLAPTLGQLIALTRRVALCISGDSGPLHLACALGRPVVGIYGPTDPSRNGPFGTRFRVLRNPQSRRDHTRRAEPEAGLLTIQPDEVLRAADELLVEETA